jgi:hypothetical protein
MNNQCHIKLKLSLCLTNYALLHEGVWGSGCIDPHFLDLGISWEWSVSRRGCFTTGKRAPGIHWIGGWVDSKAGLNNVEKKICPYRDLNCDPAVAVGQPVASHYTDYASPAPNQCHICLQITTCWQISNQFENCVVPSAEKKTAVLLLCSVFLGKNSPPDKSYGVQFDIFF